MNGSRIAGIGHYVPSRRVDNTQLEEMLNLKNGWIERRSGIKARRWVNENENLIDLAEQASREALKNAEIAQEDIGMIILATSTPDRPLPPTAPLLAHRLGLSDSGAFDLAGACSGFLYALSMADGFVRAHGKAVLVVGANILSRKINLKEQESAILFADAAGALVLTSTKDSTRGVLSSNFITDGNGYDFISISASSNEPYINLRNGPMLYSKVVAMMERCARQAMQDANLKSEDIHRFIPHQANARILKTVAKKLMIPLDKMTMTLDEYGNSSAASIPLSFSVSHQAAPFCEGEKILVAAAGAGITAGAMLICI